MLAGALPTAPTARLSSPKSPTRPPTEPPRPARANRDALSPPARLTISVTRRAAAGKAPSPADYLKAHVTADVRGR